MLSAASTMTEHKHNSLQAPSKTTHPASRARQKSSHTQTCQRQTKPTRALSRQPMGAAVDQQRCYQQSVHTRRVSTSGNACNHSYKTEAVHRSLNITSISYISYSLTTYAYKLVYMHIYNILCIGVRVCK